MPVCQATVDRAERANAFADREGRKASSEAEAREVVGRISGPSKFYV